LIKANKNKTTELNKSWNSLVPAVNDKNNFWNIHDELVTSIIKYSDKVGVVPIELRQFLNQNVIQRTDDSLAY